MRIEKDSQGGRTTIRLIGHFQSEHIEELQKQLLRQNGPRFVLDLRELTFVDLDVIRFLGSCEAGGTEVINCAPYIREWMNQDQNLPVGTTSAQENNSMEAIGLFVTLEARPGKETDAEAFLKSAQPLARDENGTLKWYAIKFGPGKFGIFDTFANETGRNAHLSGEIAKALGARASELLAVPPQIEKVEVLASTPLKG